MADLQKRTMVVVPPKRIKEVPRRHATQVPQVCTMKLSQMRTQVVPERSTMKVTQRRRMMVLWTRAMFLVAAIDILSLQGVSCCLPRPEPPSVTTSAPTTNVPCSCGCEQARINTNTNHRIIDGETVTGGATYMVALVEKVGVDGKAKKPFCGGSVISDRWILSAAHCTQETPKRQKPKIRPTNSIQVRMGTYDWQYANLGLTDDVVLIVAHNEYDSENLNYDFVMLKTNNTIPLSGHYKISKICLPFNEITSKFVDDAAIITGWGGTSSAKPNELPFQLQAGYVEVYSNSDCKPIPGPVVFTERMMCTKQRKSAPPGKVPRTCNGDSGGPLVVENKYGAVTLLIGVSSWSVSDCSAPSGYGRVTAVLHWITEVTGITEVMGGP